MDNVAFDKSTFASATSPVVLAINAGGEALTHDGISFSADQYFTDGATFGDVPEGNGLQPAFAGTVYQTERYGNFSYAIPVASASQAYTVELRFGELWWSNPGQRIFDVSLEGQTVLNDLDILGQTSDINTPYSYVSGPITAGANGTLDLQFLNGLDNAKLSGIIVRQVDAQVGSDGDDFLIGGDGADAIYGGAGNDVLAGQAGNDQLIGGDANDTLIGGNGADLLDGGDGFDFAFYGNSSAVTVDLSTGIGTGGEADGDSYFSIESVIGSEFADTITGSASGNELLGGGGDDMLEGLAGADFLSGGAGNDTASYLSSDAAVNVSLAVQAGAGGHAAGDVLVGIENLYGSGYDDVLTGDAGANLLFGAAGYDTLQGGTGDDVLIGGEGGDVLAGGDGTDLFLFRPELAGSGDLVLDFDQAGDDFILFSGFGAGFAETVQTAALNDTDVIVYSNAWDSHVVLKNAVGRVDASDFLFA